MPLMQGKSPKAFSKNVAAEMHAGKPQKQALAIAYSVKRRNAKKMAKGGMVNQKDMGRNMDPIVSQHSQENEDLNPSNEPEHGAERLVMGQMKLKAKAQNHEDLEESKADPGSANAYKPKTMSLRKEPKQAQANLPMSEQGAHFAAGGEVGSALSRRERAIRAAMGKAGAAVVMEHAMDGMNEGPSRNPGPSGVNTPIHDDVPPRKQFPDSHLSPEAQEAYMAGGGLIKYPDPELSEDEQACFYADGGMTGNEISSPRNQVAVMKEGYGKYPNHAEEDEGEHFGKGGMPSMRNPKIMAMSIRKKMAMGGYAEGGPVDEMGLQDQEYDTDRFMAHNMEDSHFDHLTHEDVSDEVANDNPKDKRKKILSGIMRNLHGMHAGK